MPDWYAKAERERRRVTPVGTTGACRENPVFGDDQVFHRYINIQGRRLLIGTVTHPNAKGFFELLGNVNELRHNRDSAKQIKGLSPNEATASSATWPTPQRHHALIVIRASD